jgi:hypothetical protein
MRFSFVPCLSIAAAVASCAERPADLSRLTLEERRSATDLGFRDAADEFAIPESVLKGIGFVESRFAQRPNERALDNGFGVMHLAENALNHSLSRAQALTGLSREALLSDPAANIRGGAAVLREEADRLFASTPNLNPGDLGDWFPVVMRYAAIDDPRLAEGYAHEVFAAMSRGERRALPDGWVVLDATPADFGRHLIFGSRRESALTPDYPSASWRPSPNFSNGRSEYKWIVVHTVQGSYAGAISWFQNPASQVSAHYVVRSSDGAVTQTVEHQDTAWHVQCYNGRSIGIEHEGYVSDPKWYTPAMYASSAKLARWIADKHGIPRDRSHFIGHNEVARNCNTSGHTDPGPNWNWTTYMNLVNGTTPGPTTGEIKGVVYQDPDMNRRLAGASVKVTGNGVTRTQTVGADAMYALTLPPGTYSVEASLSGFSASSVSRAVTSNQTVWGSIGLKPINVDGTFTGTVFTVDAANPATPRAADGATVALSSGKSDVTGSDGTFRFSVPPGSYTATAAMVGFQSGSATATIAAGQTAKTAIYLRPIARDQEPPKLTIDSPLDKSAFDLARVSVRGSATDNADPLTSVSVFLNGAAAGGVPVAMGRFEVEVKLSPGPNVVEIRAVDAAGNAAGTQVQLHFRSGLDGQVLAAGEADKPVLGARVALFGASGAAVGETATAADGAFRLDVPPGEYVLRAAREGFRTHQETVTIGSEERTTVRLAMRAGSDVAPALRILSPADGATVTRSPVMVEGTLTGFQATRIEVNGLPAELGIEGAFIALVPVELGETTLVVVATGAAGESARAEARITRTVRFFAEKARGEAREGGAAGVPRGACGCGASGPEVFPAAALLVLLGIARRRSLGA